MIHFKSKFDERLEFSSYFRKSISRELANLALDSPVANSSRKFKLTNIMNLYLDPNNSF